MSNKIVVFYSRAGENYVDGGLKEISVGNTEKVSNMIAELTGADLFKIEEVKPYSSKYNECVEEAKNDQKNNSRPELKKYPESLDNYDVVYLGYPNYWGTMPMAVFTFLEHFDFSGKVIKPFCTHEGSGMGNSVEDIKRECPLAKVETGLAIQGSSVENAKDKVEKWVL